ncbi:hypothetical protein ACGFU4_36190 [Streptomyces sp. NPDC048511]|uniref:hypothetical protein n=1 Tax=Streptomyces sp. NPDC048511 TaxID=3365562 RepID=UPI003715FA6E
MARSKVKVTFDTRAFERGIKKAAGETAQKLAADLTKMLNGMSGEFKGRPVEEIKPVLQQRWKRTTDGGSITDPELTQYAEQIIAGGTFNITADELS